MSIKVFERDILDTVVFDVELTQRVSFSKAMLATCEPEQMKKILSTKVLDCVTNTVMYDIQKMFEESNIEERIRMEENDA